MARCGPSVRYAFGYTSRGRGPMIRCPGNPMTLSRVTSPILNPGAVMRKAGLNSNMRLLTEDIHTARARQDERQEITMCREPIQRRFALTLPHILKAHGDACWQNVTMRVQSTCPSLKILVYDTCCGTMDNSHQRMTLRRNTRENRKHTYRIACRVA